MADFIFDHDTFTPTAQDFDGSWHTFGSRAELDAAGNLTGGAARFPNPTPGTYRWIVYKMSDQSVVAEVNLAALPGTTPGAWNEFTSASFDTPGDVALDDAEQYFVAVASPGDFVYRDSGVAFPYGAGAVHAIEAGFFNGGSGPTFPDSFTTGFVFFADMHVNTAGPVAVTGQSTAVASARSTAAKIATTAGRTSATVGASSTAAKVTTPAGRSTAVAAATAAAVKVVACTARCSAIAATTAAATTRRPATGRATAGPSTTATAGKRASVAGTATGIALASKAAQDVRNVTARCSGIAATTLRLRLIRRPNTGTISRPNIGVILRP